MSEECRAVRQPMIPLILILVVAAATNGVHAQGDSSVPFGDAPTSHRRLYGIKRLRLLRPASTPTPLVSPTVPKTFGQDDRSFRRQQPRAIAPPAFEYSVPRAQVPPALYEPHQPINQVSREEDPVRGVESFSHRTASGELDEIRKKRIEARWKKLGINFEKINNPYKALLSREESSSERVGSSEQRIPKKTRYPISEEKRKSSQARLQKYNVIPKDEDKEVVRVSAVDTRKSVPNPVQDKDQSLTHRSNKRPRVNGPILRSIDDRDKDSGYGRTSPGFGSGGFGASPKSGGGSGFGLGSDSGLGGGSTSPFDGFGSKSGPSEFKEDVEDVGPISPAEMPLHFPAASGAVTSSPERGNYHSRTTPTYKHFKFTQKLAQRPRLRIRRPGDNAARVEGTKNANIGDLPHLTPYQNQARQKHGYEPIEYPQRFVDRERFTDKPEPVIVTRTMPNPTTTATTTTTTEAPVEEGESGAGFGDGGSAFSGPSELPPEFANVGFGIGGDNGVNFAVPVEKKEKAAPKPKRPIQRKQPTGPSDKDDVVIPQNSGLRPVSPPKELLGSGSFGSGSGGSPFGSFGGGGGGGAPDFGDSGNGFESGNAPSPSKGRGARPAPPTQPELTEEDLFTGESALGPSKGPSGDGYGPAVFPGGAVPPVVGGESVNVGGAAAGIPPPEVEAPRRPNFDTTENPPTTVKPSALLNVLNRADLGFNQAITHFEQGSPIETAAIDILEVALGSQKLDSQAKLLGHVDRAFGLDNLQRMQRWANTAGALDMLKEQVVKIAKNYQPPEDLFPTIAPQFEYLFKSSGKK